MRTPSLASQLLQQHSGCYRRHRRSRLAGEWAFEPCIALASAFAGKPAPTAAFGVLAPPP
ncbi:hypothetical protein CW358_12405 [Pseudomonas protegens]|nr:hypothetical protein CW358_12405 [Pseudomonas protegens]